jgi:DNA-directed RNA polymerase
MSNDLTEVQLELENESDRMAFNRYGDTVRGKIDSTKEGDTVYGSALMKRAIAPMIIKIEEFIKEAETGGAGRRHSALKFIKMLPSDVVAFIAARTLVDQLSGEITLASAAGQIARALEREVMHNTFHSEEAGLWSKLSRQIAKEPDSRKRAIVKHTYQKFVGEWVTWSEVNRLHVGTKLVEVFIEATGFMEVTLMVPKNNPKLSKNILKPTAAIMEWISRSNANAYSLFPVTLPMVVKPLPWTTPYDGGYLSLKGSQFGLVKTRNKAYLTELCGMGEQMAQVYESINAIQDVPWQVNSRVLEVISSMWEQQTALAGLPERTELPLPIFKHNGVHKDDWTDQQREDFAAFKQTARKTHEYNGKLRSRSIQAAQIIAIAQKFNAFDEIFFPQKMDFRGRVYSVPMFLNPQGNDISKGLLHFSKGKPLGTGTGVGWLAIQGANSWGEDKVTLEDRIEWVHANEERIKQVAKDPLSDFWWTEADSPLCFLAFCFEWGGYCEQGTDFVSHLPIALDGSCSGIQHFSAALRDEVGGAAVNLTKGEKPSDVYQEVADKVVTKLRHNLTTCGEDAIAQRLLEFGITRSATKRSTMTLPYGSTRYSCKSFTFDWIAEQSEKMTRQNLENPLEGVEMEAANYLGDLIWDSIGEVVIAARDAMDWLRKTAIEVTKDGLPLYWTTPDGLPVMQDYQDMKARRVKTRLGDCLIYTTLQEEQDKLDSRRQANGVAPNWVHSMDATHLRMTVIYARDNGLTDFALIHDSFGCHACDTDMLSSCLREAMIDVYQDDVLAKFSNEVTQYVDDLSNLPDMPKRGTLDLNSIRESDYIFA